MTQELRQPIITVAGHVDHGKTSLLDAFRGSDFQREEAGGITQKISFTKYPLEQIMKSCPLIDKGNIKLEIPGFLFIDTPGHAAFTSLRKRGGSLADLAIVVVSIKEGIKPQTAEVLQILKANKTPFVIALNKIDSISGWTKHDNLRNALESQAVHTKQDFDEALLTFQGSLSQHGFDSDLYFEVSDFTKKVAIVPCSARTREGIPELLLVLCGLCQRFLKERLTISQEAKGVILEIKKDKNLEYNEAILYDGSLDEGDELVVANFGEPIAVKVRSIQEIMPLSSKYASVKKALAAAGVRMQFTEKKDILPGMPFQEVKGNIEKIKAQFRREISNALSVDKEGIIIKADSLGSLEALITLLRQENIRIVKAGIGPISKTDILSAKANLEINPLDAVVVGFNVELEKDLEKSNIKIFTNEVIYKLIEDLQEWRKKKQEDIEKEKILGLATICKLEIIHKYVFRNSNPAIFGAKILAGKLRSNLPLIDDKGEEVARVKSIQSDKSTVEEVSEGKEVAVALPGVAFDRRLKDVKFLYSSLSTQQIKQLKKNEEFLSGTEMKIIEEIENLRKALD
ncbi:MAG: translation initiation factor IF-2 [Nanoarchaeota archaeon]|nr:translation initiation factor IF-2 [Nanoarchaeota archaeon]